MFPERTKFYIYPALDKKTGSIMNVDNLSFPNDVNHVYRYLLDNKLIVKLTDVKKEWLNISSDEVLRFIQTNQIKWENMVPKYVVKTIKSKKLFGYSG
jgi:nicotinic acid mononucleotide adenylyltransferase